MTRKYFSIISKVFRAFFARLISLPNFLKQQFARIIEDYKKLRYKLSNLAESNLDLGVYHLRCRNYNDAIFRFKLVDKFLDPHNKLANYWLGWSYFMKQNYRQAINYLARAEDIDEIGLLPFIKSIDNATYIPSAIHAMHRDIIADIIIDKYITKEENLIIELVSEFNNQAKNLPEEYSILELGANVGMLGDEIHKRMQESYTLTGVEISEKMIELQLECFPNSKPYDGMINSPVEEFLEREINLYDVVYSLDGFSTNADLKKIFSNVFSVLNINGYFAFIVKIDKQNSLSNKFLEFAYSTRYVKDTLKEAGFKILSVKDFSLEIKNNYSIFVCTK